jgi:hypothetical protein
MEASFLEFFCGIGSVDVVAVSGQISGVSHIS